MIKPLVGTLEANQTQSTTETNYVSPGIAPEKILPGTVRPVAVFIPAQYHGSEPACAYVKTDGYNPREKELLERLIATGEMPVTISAFVGPGDVPAPMKNRLGWRNRDFEYDGMGDNNVRFLLEELLPFVAREYHLNLSKDGNDAVSPGEQ